jgi:hypothetical protein
MATRLAAISLKSPKWLASVQAHKLLGWTKSPYKMIAHESTRHHQFEFRSGDIGIDRKYRAHPIAPAPPLAIYITVVARP